MSFERKKEKTEEKEKMIWSCMKEKTRKLMKKNEVEFVSAKFSAFLLGSSSGSDSCFLKLV